MTEGEAEAGVATRPVKKVWEVEGGSFSPWKGPSFYPEVLKKSSPSQVLAVSANLLTEAISLGFGTFLFSTVSNTLTNRGL